MSAFLCLPNKDSLNIIAPILLDAITHALVTRMSIRVIASKETGHITGYSFPDKAKLHSHYRDGHYIQCSQCCERTSDTDSEATETESSEDDENAETEKKRKKYTHSETCYLLRVSDLRTNASFCLSVFT